MKSIILVVFIISQNFLFASVEVADINGQKIELAELNKKYELNRHIYQTKPLTKKAVLDDMVTRELGIQRAKKLGLENNPLVQERIGTVLFSALIEKELGEKFREVNITDRETANYYAQNPTIRSAHILVKISPFAPESEQKKAKEKINGIYKNLIANPKKFARLAREFSDSPEAGNNGDLNFRRRDELDPAFYAALLKLKEEAISEPVRSQFGWHVIKRGKTLPFAKEDKGKIRAQIFDKKREDIFQAYFQTLRKNSKVSVNYSKIQ